MTRSRNSRRGTRKRDALPGISGGLRAVIHLDENQEREISDELWAAVTGTSSITLLGAR